MRHTFNTGFKASYLAALLLAVGLTGLGCEGADEIKDNFDSRVACGDYCDKKFACENKEPADGERDTCVSACRDAIENKCGNEHQAAANDKIGVCVDKGCIEFRTCMTFEAAPSCYGFIN